jgi:hypothetical protein
MAVELTSLLDIEQRATGKDERFETTPFFPILQNYQESGERKILVTFNKGYVVSATKMIENGGADAVKSSFAYTAPSNITTVWKLDKDEDVSFSLRFKTKPGSSVIEPNEIRIEVDEPSISEADNESLIQIDHDGSLPIATYRMPMCRIKAGKLVSLVLRENIHWQQPSFANAEQEEEDYGILKSTKDTLAGASEVNAPPVTLKNLRAGTGIGIESAENFLSISLGDNMIVRDEKDFAAYYEDGNFWIRGGRILNKRIGVAAGAVGTVGVTNGLRPFPHFELKNPTLISRENGKYVYLHMQYTFDTAMSYYVVNDIGLTLRVKTAPVYIDVTEVVPSIKQRSEASFYIEQTEDWIPIGEFNDDGKFVQKHDGPVFIGPFVQQQIETPRTVVSLTSF